MNRAALATRADAILSSLDAGESPRKIVDALVRDHGAVCEWRDGSPWNEGYWTLQLMGVRAFSSTVNGTLLRDWCLRASGLTYSDGRGMVTVGYGGQFAGYRRKRGWLPRVGFRTASSPALDDMDDPRTVDFEGRALVIVWGRFSVELFGGART